MVVVNTDINIEPHMVVEGLSYEEALQFIIEMEEEVGDVGFLEMIYEWARSELERE